MIFFEKTCKKGLKQKSEHHHWIISIWNSLSTKFQSKSLLTILNFWIKLNKKGNFQYKKSTMKITIEFYIFQRVFVLYFSFSNFDFLEKIPQKMILLIENRKNEHHYWVVHIRISSNTKLQLKLKIIISWTKFTQSVSSLWKIKWTSPSDSVYSN